MRNVFLRSPAPCEDGRFHSVGEHSRRRPRAGCPPAPRGVALGGAQGGGRPVWERGPPGVPPRPPPLLLRQARSRAAGIPSSWAIWLNGRPLLASSSTASRLNSSVYWRRDAPIRHLPAPSEA